MCMHVVESATQQPPRLENIEMKASVIELLLLSGLTDPPSDLFSTCISHTNACVPSCGSSELCTNKHPTNPSTVPRSVSGKKKLNTSSKNMRPHPVPLHSLIRTRTSRRRAINPKTRRYELTKDQPPPPKTSFSALQRPLLCGAESTPGRNKKQ